MPRKRREIPWLEQRDGVFYVYWYDKATGFNKRLSLRTTDTVDAQQRYATFLAEGHALFRGDKDRGLGVADALDQYYREHKVVAEERREIAIRHLKSWFKDTPVREIDIPACRAYMDARRTGVIGGGTWRGGKLRHASGSDSTIRRELGVLNAAAQHALKWRRIQRGDLPSVERPLDEQHDAAWLTREELKKTFAESTGWLQDFITVVYYTAARKASVERMLKCQVDLAAGHIKLTSPQETQLQRRSKKRRPVVPIDPRLRPTVERLMLAEGDWLFGKQPLADTYHPFHKFITGLGLSHEKAHPHVLRHTRATHLLQDGVSIYDVAHLLGDTVQTIERVYGHHSPEYLARAIEERRPRLRAV